MVEMVLNMAANLTVGLYVARYLGPVKFGLLGYGMSFVGLFSALATLGLDQITVRELVRNKVLDKTLLGTVFLLKLGGGFLVIVAIAAVLVIAESDPLTKQLVIIVACGLIFQSFDVISFYFQSRVISRYSVLARSIQLVLSSVVKVLLVLNQASLIWFALVILADSIMIAAGLLVCLYRFDRDLAKGWRFDAGLAGRLMKDSWPLALSGLVVTIYMKIDQVMIKEMLDAEAVGLYASAVRLSEFWYFIPGIVLNSFFPAIISARDNNRDCYYDRLQQLHDFLSAAAIPIALFVFFFADEIIDLLFGHKFAGAGAILSVHIWAGVVVFPGNVRAHLLILENKQLVALGFRTLGAILNVSLNLILIPMVGPIGAAWATLASYIVPVLIVAAFDPIIRLTVIMTGKSYLLPFRVLVYGRGLYGRAACRSNA